MKTVLIIHGIGGHAGIHWQQWLNYELTKLGCTVSMPEMPNPNKPDRQTWLNTIIEVTKNIDKSELIIIGHSLGVTTALDFIEQLNQKIYGFISVSGFAEDYGAELNGYFLKQKHIDFEEVKNNLSWSEVIYGDDDPYVTQKALRYVADSLGAEPIAIKDGGHLNTETGYIKFPELLEIVKTKII